MDWHGYLNELIARRDRRRHLAWMALLPALPLILALGGFIALKSPSVGIEAWLATGIFGVSVYIFLVRHVASWFHGLFDWTPVAVSDRKIERLLDRLDRVRAREGVVNPIVLPTVLGAFLNAVLLFGLAKAVENDGFPELVWALYAFAGLSMAWVVWIFMEPKLLPVALSLMDRVEHWYRKWPAHARVPISFLGSTFGGLLGFYGKMVLFVLVAGMGVAGILSGWQTREGGLAMAAVAVLVTLFFVGLRVLVAELNNRSTEHLEQLQYSRAVEGWSDETVRTMFEAIELLRVNGQYYEGSLTELRKDLRLKVRPAPSQAALAPENA